VRRLFRALAIAAASAAAAAGEFDLDLALLNELSPRPGLTLDTDNLAHYGHFVEPDVARFVVAGQATLAVGQPLSFDPHPAYLQATRQFHGRPFPGEPATEDPEAGRKIAWNMRYAWMGDNGLLPEIHWQLRDWRSERTVFEMLFKARSQRFMYRHVLDPVPFVHDNPEDAYGAFLLTAIDAGSYDGTQALAFANRDESREVNGWVYIPQLGRTQTLAAFSTEESMFGSDILPTDFLLYAGRLVDLEWRYLGSTYLLLPFYRHDQIELSTRKARNHEYWHADLGGRAGCFPRVHWQLRPTLILEGRARDPAALAARRLFFVDRQTFVSPLWKIYRDDGTLWKIMITAYAHPNSHLPENHESGAPIPTVATAIDIRSNRCTTLQLLTIVNSAEVEAADFDAGIMQSGGRGEFRRR
jgi:hypothetical protein